MQSQGRRVARMVLDLAVLLVSLLAVGTVLIMRRAGVLVHSSRCGCVRVCLCVCACAHALPEHGVASALLMMPWLRCLSSQSIACCCCYYYYCCCCCVECSDPNFRGSTQSFVDIVGSVPAGLPSLRFPGEPLLHRRPGAVFDGVVTWSVSRRALCRDALTSARGDVSVRQTWGRLRRTSRRCC